MNLYQVGQFCKYENHDWQIYSFSTDDDGFLVVTLIDAKYNDASGKTSPAFVYVRDLSAIRSIAVAA